MACYLPIDGYRLRDRVIDGQVIPGKVQIGKPPPLSEPLRLPCNYCIGCTKARAREWALRCYLELAEHKRASFATLTYDDNHVPVTLSRRHLQLFLKRARKALGPTRPLRFFASGEYGEQTGRPHYHAILYGTEDEQLVRDTWKLGHSSLSRVTPARVAYVAGYSSKKIGWRDLADQERIDYSTGEVYTWQPPFIQMSRRPGIGGHARKWADSWRAYAVYNGQKQPVPRFLHEAWKAQATAEEIQTLKDEKAALAAQRDTSWPRLEAGLQLEIAKQKIRAARRKL